MTLSGLDQPCAVCERRSGDHTLDEWQACMGTRTADLPYEAVPDDLAEAAAEAVRKQFLLAPELIITDHMVLRSAMLSGSSGQVGVKIPVLIHDFQIGVSGKGPTTVAKVLYMAGDGDGIRAYGRLVRDHANAAANRVEGL